MSAILLFGSVITTSVHLEVQACLDFLCQHFGDGSVKVRNHFHRKLRLDAAVVHHGVERIDQSQSDAVGYPPLVLESWVDSRW